MLNYSANGPSGYNLTNSLRFRSSASAYLSRTFSASGTTDTWSFWVKRGALSTNQYIFGWTNSATASLQLNFESDNTFSFVNVSGGLLTAQLTTTQVFRDPSAWYHIIMVIDTTQATAANRLKLYVNGTQVTSFGTATYPAQNASLAISNSAAWDIGARGATNNIFLDGYLTEFNFIDGQALTPSSFGNTNSVTGVWQPAKYTGTYGTNGFYLNFNSIALTSGSNTGLGKDNSGNGNYWNTNNISVTAGTTYDAMTDVPTLTSATVANYAVMNPLWKDGTTVIAQGNLDVSNGNYGGFSTLTIPTNSKFYAEFTVTATQGNQGVGILKAANAYSGVISQADMFGSNSVTYYCVNGNKFVLGGGSTAYGSSWGTIGDVIGIAVDTVNNQITFYKNNTSQGVITGLTSGIEWVFSTGNQTNTGGGAWNFGQRPFSYTPPTGYVALNTYNLPTSTIVQGNKYMDATLYTGNNTTNNIVNAGGFKPDLVWIKSRSNAGTNNYLTNSNAGRAYGQGSNITDAQYTSGASNDLTAFNSNGFSLGSISQWDCNNNGYTFVGWQWQAGQGSSSSNTNGSITSTVSVNATAGFSVVTYSGTGANATVGHGLGVAPKMYFVKNRNQVGDWCVYHVNMNATPQNYYMQLNLTSAAGANSTIWNNTAPTSTTFSIGSYLYGNGVQYIAYCWAEIAGFSKFGSYTGNGSADGPFVYLGFRPRFIIIKQSSASGEQWIVWDSVRTTYNPNGLYLHPSLSNAESTFNALDFVSNGFKVIINHPAVNTNGATYIYMAFAENPFKNALAR